MMRTSSCFLWLSLSTVIAGCSTLDRSDDPIAAKAATAVTREQHLEIAALYDTRSQEESNNAGRHRAWAMQERLVSENLNRGRAPATIPSIMRGHCDTLEAQHARAASDDLEAAQRHRRMALEAPDQ